MIKAIFVLLLSIVNVVCWVMAISYIYKFTNSHAMYDFQWAVILLICTGGSK